MNVHFKMVAGLSTLSLAALLLLAAPATAEVFHSKQSAFAAAFPAGADVEQVNVFLSDEDAAWIKSHAGVEWPGRLANVYVARKDGEPVAYGYFDTHKVRTLDETVLLVVRPDGHLEQVVQVAFHEPAEYRAPGRWLAQFRDRALDPKLSLKADIDGLSGATLTARALTASVRAVLALHQRKFGASPGDTKGLMRFVVTGEWSRNTLLRLIVAMFLVFVLLFVVSSAMLFFTRMSLDPAKVVEYFLGEPHLEFGRPPRPYKALVETSHMHLFAMGMLVMVLTHLLLFVPIKPALKGWLVLVSFAAALLDELSNWLVRFASPAFAWLKIGSFVVMEVSLSLLVIVLAVYVARPGRNAYKDTQPKG